MLYEPCTMYAVVGPEAGPEALRAMLDRARTFQSFTMYERCMMFAVVSGCCTRRKVQTSTLSAVEPLGYVLTEAWTCELLHLYIGWRNVRIADCTRNASNAQGWRNGERPDWHDLGLQCLGHDLHPSEPQAKIRTPQW